jgi:tRNA threonylcarbamoyladenosine biosynthesis protein TsaB
LVERSAYRERLLAAAQPIGRPVLAIDTAAAQGTICLVDPGRGAFEEVELTALAMPSESLVETIARTLQRMTCKPTDLGAVVVALGPGSFTGLRVGLATAKGLCLGAGVPLFGYASFAALALAGGQGLASPLLDARHGQIFCALYRTDGQGQTQPLIEDGVRPLVAWLELLSTQEEPVRAIGAGVELLPETMSARVTRDPNVVAKAGYGILAVADRLRRGEPDDVATLVPHYLQASEAEKKLT